MTTRDEEILAALCSKVRFFSLEQIARDWWPETADSQKLARRRMLAHVADDWLKIVRVPVRPLLVLEAPAAEWELDAPAPDFRGLSQKLRARWKMPALKTELFLASVHARSVFGGRALGSVKNLCQTTHDLHVAEVFLHYRRTNPSIAAAWVGEDAMAPKRKRQKLPDAFLQNQQGELVSVIEFGGAYAVSRLADLHADCARRHLPYEIW